MRKILAIDGGGIRGIIPALVLAEIESRTGKPAAQLFDLMAGTSTGGIISLALSRDRGQRQPRFRALDLAEMYEKRGREIFHRSFWDGVSSVGGLAKEKYPVDSLEAVLMEYFDQDPLESALTGVLISSYDIQNRCPFFFKSWDKKTQSIPMRLAARATSAAPTYFEPALVPVQGDTLALIDGGVFVNNPAMSAYAEACRIFPKETEFIVVSLGTGELTRPISYEEARNWGLAGWAIPILNVVFDGVSDAVDYQLDKILGDKHFRFQTRLDIANDDMDNASRANVEALKMEAANLLQVHQDPLDRLIELLKEQG